MIEKKRLVYLDWAKAISISMIVAGHFLPVGCWQKVLMYCFHVPIFVIIGGLTATPTATFKDCFKRIGKLSVRLLIPYIIWFAVFSIAHFLPKEQVDCGLIVPRDPSQLWKLFLFWENETIWNDPLWFIPGYYIICVAYTLYLKLTKGSYFASFLAALLAFGVSIYMDIKEITIDYGEVVNVMGARNIIVLFGFYATGYALKGVVNAVMNWRETPYKNPFLYVALIGFIEAAYFAVQANAVDDPKNPAGYYTLSFYSGLFNGMSQFIVYALLLSFTLIIACGLLPKMKGAELFSRNSYFIMCTHYVFFFDDTFEHLKRKEWLTDLAHSTRDVVFILVIFWIFLRLLDYLFTRFPKVRILFKPFGIL